MRISDGIRFRIVPDWVLAKASPSAVVAYCVLQRFARDSAAAQVSQDRLARELSCSVRSVRNWIAELEAIGAIQVRRHRGDQGAFRINEIVVCDRPAEVGDAAAAFPMPEATSCPPPQAAAFPQVPESEDQELRKQEQAPAGGTDLRRAMFGALATAVGLDPATLTRIERGRLNRAVKDLLEVGATIEEVARRAEIHRRVWPTATLTATSLSANWTTLGQGETGADRLRRLVAEGLSWTR